MKNGIKIMIVLCIMFTFFESEAVSAYSTVQEAIMSANSPIDSQTLLQWKYVNFSGNAVYKGIKRTNIPTNFWNLNNNPYIFTVSNVNNYVYTDYYFGLGSTGQIKINFVTLNSGGNNITVRCYEIGSNNQIVSYTCNPNAVAGIFWSGLSQSKMYYLKFEISSGILSGSCIIST